MQLRGHRQRRGDGMEGGDFNGTQEVISAPECGDAMQAAAVMRKMSEWLREERPWLL